MRRLWSQRLRYALRHGMPGGRYIFSTSNCVYTGMQLARYELILDVWRREGTTRQRHTRDWHIH